MARPSGYGPEVPSSKEHVGDAPRVSLTDPHKWLHKLHTFARNAGIEQPINLAEKTGATGSSPMFLLALGCMLGVTFDNVAGDERTVRRLRRTGDDEADGENVYSSASRTYTPGDFDKPPDTETYICTRAGVDSIDQARFKNLAKMEASGEAFHKNNAVLADAMRVAIGKNRPIINYLASKNVDYSDCHDGGLLFLHAITYLLSDENEVPRDAAEQGWSDTKQSVDETASEYRLRFNRMCKTLDRAHKQGAFTKSPSAKAKRFCTTCTKDTYSIIAPLNDDPKTMDEIGVLIDKHDAKAARRALASGEELDDDTEPSAAAMAATSTNTKCTHCGCQNHTADQCRKKLAGMSSEDATAEANATREAKRKERKERRVATASMATATGDDHDDRDVTFAAFSAATSPATATDPHDDHDAAFASVWQPTDSDGDPVDPHSNEDEEHGGMEACGTMPVAVEGGEPNATDSYTDDKHDLRRPGLNWSQIGASAAVACLATIVTMHIANGIT